MTSTRMSCFPAREIAATETTVDIRSAPTTIMRGTLETGRIVRHAVTPSKPRCMCGMEPMTTILKNYRIPQRLSQPNARNAESSSNSVRMVLHNAATNTGARSAALRKWRKDFVEHLHPGGVPKATPDAGRKAAAQLSLEYDAVISTAFVRSEDYRTRNTPFLMNVRREGGRYERI